MEDEFVVAAFEAAELPGDEFTHTQHVRVAWWYLRQHPFPQARDRFIAALRRFAASKGAAKRYHATITTAYLLLIAERVHQTPSLAWPAFAEGHADLLARSPSILARYYTDERLHSKGARGAFVMPDREMLPMLACVGCAVACGTDVVPVELGPDRVVAGGNLGRQSG